MPLATTSPVAPSTPVDDTQIAKRVLDDLRRQIDLMLEVRLREALAPVLARAADTLIRDARKEMTAAMQDVVSRTIADELARRGKR